MASASRSTSTSFTDLPLELRRQVYEILFFDDLVTDYAANSLGHSVGRKNTAPRQIHPYSVADPRSCYSGAHHSPHGTKLGYKSVKRFPLAIFRTNHMIQTEAEAVFYGSASFNLMSDQDHGRISSWEWLSQLPCRYRKLITRVEHFCYSFVSASGSRGGGETCYSSFDWLLFMRILAQECPALQSLRLWVLSDSQESEWLAGATEADSWVQAILQLETLEHLRHLDICPIRFGTSRDLLDDPIRGGFSHHVPPIHYCTRISKKSPWLGRQISPRPIQSESFDSLAIVQKLKARLEKSSQRELSRPCRQKPFRFYSPFRLLDLPGPIRIHIFRHVVLPPNRRIHPYIKSWYDKTTRNAVPLLLTCRKIRKEAEEVLYRDTIFTVPSNSNIDAGGALKNFFQDLPPRLRAKIRFVQINSFRMSKPSCLIEYVASEMNLEELVMVLFPGEARRADRLRSWGSWQSRMAVVENWFHHEGDEQEIFQQGLGRLKRVQLYTTNPEEDYLLPDLQEYFDRHRKYWVKPVRKAAARISMNTHAVF